VTLGRHAVRELPTGRPSLGPIRSPWEHEPPDDPHGLREKRPANFAGVPGPRLPADDSLPSRARRPVRPHAALALTRVAAAVAELATVGLVSIHVVTTALSAPPRPGEVFGVAQVVAAVRPDIAAVDGPWPHHVFSAVVAAWVSPTSALQRHATALTAVREAMAVAGVAVVLLVWLLVRRLRLAVPTRIAAVVLLVFVPTGTALLTEVRPGLLGAGGLLVATALVAGERVGATQRVLALLGLAAAAVLVPAALPALLAAIAVLFAQGDLAAGWAVRARMALGGLLGVAAVAALVANVIGPEQWRAWLASASPATGPVPDLSELPLLLAALALTLAALARRWLRAPAIVVIMLLGVALLVEPARADLFTMALPLAAVVALAGAEDRIAGLWVARSASVRLRSARTLNTQTQAALRAAGAVACAIVALTGLVATATRPVPRAVPPPAAEVAGWFDDEVVRAPVLVVDDGLWPELLRAGLPAGRMQVLSRSARNDPARWRVTAGYVDRTAAMDTGWVPYAAFGNEAGRVTVLRRIEPPLGATAYQRQETLDRRDRASFGAELANNPKLTFAPPAAQALRAGDVDERLMEILADMSGWNSFGITDFPAVPGEDGNGLPRRRVVLSTVGDRPVTDPDSGNIVRSWLDKQIDMYRPQAVELTGDGMLVRYPVPDSPIS